MKIYFVAPELFALKLTDTILLSYYDITISKIPFRKISFKYILNKRQLEYENIFCSSSESAL